MVEEVDVVAVRAIILGFFEANSKVKKKKKEKRKKNAPVS
jgi:hypothetical protein